VAGCPLAVWLYTGLGSDGGSGVPFSDTGK